MVTAALLAIGNELLEGSTVDTNSAFLSSRLVDAGITVSEIRALPDSLDVLVESMKQAADRFDLVLTTGGLGPTFDDVTPEALARTAGRHLVFNETAYNHLEARLSSKGITIKESHRRQAHLPEDVQLFDNDLGTALGFSLTIGHSVFVAMPGVPYEMKGMFENDVLPWLQTTFKLEQRVQHDLRFFGIPESDIDDVIGNIAFPDSVQCIINASHGEIIVRIRSFNGEHLEAISDEIRTQLPHNFIGFKHDTPAYSLVNLLKEHDLTLAVAESCTGGMLGENITSIAGSSEVFMGGIISYTNEVKNRQLAVPLDVLEEFGAVSEPTAEHMARNVAERFGAHAGISITGIAGPGGGTDENPVGTVFIGLYFEGDIRVKRSEFPGDRESIRLRAVKSALRGLYTMIRETQHKFQEQD